MGLQSESSTRPDVPDRSLTWLQLMLRGWLGAQLQLFTLVATCDLTMWLGFLK